MNPELKKPRVVAHRGASGHAPESTLAAYRLALQLGVDGIEMDVHRLQDGILVAIHDPDVQRTTNGKGKISELTIVELKALDAGIWFNKACPEKARPEYIGLKIPTLQEIIDLTKDSPVELYVEIKDPERYPPDPEASLLSIVGNNRVEKRTRFISFSAPSIHRIKTLSRSIKTALLIAASAGDPLQQALKVSADELALQHKLITPALIDDAHKSGLSVAAWTVDEPADLQRMIQLGVDCIITNYPDRLNSLLRK
jgi:glycerophosphoryl diester phosphodiesterase